MEDHNVYTQLINQDDKFSFKDERALDYVKIAAESLVEQGKSMITNLPDIMVKSGQAVNAFIKGVFAECDFVFALFIEKDYRRPGRKFLGVSALSTLASMDVTQYLYNDYNAGLLEYLEKESTIEEIVLELCCLMESVYDAAT